MLREPLPLDLLRQVDPIDIDRYARSAGWRRVNGFDQRRMTVYERPDLELRQLLVPARQVDDYERAVADVVEKLAEIEQRSGREVLVDLLLSPSDSLRISLIGAEADRIAVSLSLANDMIHGSRQALQAAACSVVRPREYHVRLAYPKPNNFWMPAGCSRQTRVDTTLSSLARSMPCPGLLAESLSRVGRQVYSCEALGHLVAVVETGQERLLLASPDVTLFSGNLCEALLLMRPTGRRSALSFRMTWARVAPHAPAPSATQVCLDEEHFSVVEQLAARLRSQAGASRELFVGFVEVLRGTPGADDRPTGEVVVSILHDDGAVKARMMLDADDYSAAGQAHLHHRPVRFEGVLIRDARLQRIDEVTDFAPVQRTVAASTG